MPRQTKFIPLTFGSRETAAQWAIRLEEIGSSLQDQEFDLAAEDVFQAAEWLAAYAEAR
jgi:hypothetical protein